MTQARVTKTINATADAVWAKVGKPENIHQWHPAITASPRDGQLRRCVLADGAEVNEKILEENDHERFYRYAITKSPLPVEGYEARVSVDAKDGVCTLTWDAQFEALAPEAEVKAIIESVMQAGVDSVQAAFA
jgi:hypothetical protein